MEKVKRDLYGGRFLAAIIITSLLFFLVFYFSNEIINKKSISINEKQQELYYSFVLEQMKSEFVKDCEDLSFNKLSEELGRMGDYLDILEKKVGKDNYEEIQFEKKMYSALEIQHMILSEKKNKLCNNINSTILLFFYSNYKEDVEESEKVGRMLMNIKDKNPEILIYSFDINLDFELLNYLKEEYNISKPNTISFGKNKIVSPKNNNEIYNLINL